MKKEEIMKIEADKQKEFAEALNRILESHDGIILYNWLLKECGLFEPSTVYNLDGEISLTKTMYNEARRNVILSLRKFIEPKLLIKLEIEK